MSELKAGIIYADFNRNLFIYHGAEEKDSVLEDDEEVYKKSEADKVIAELEKKLDIYKRGWMENDRVNANQYTEIRHQKYRRCLAMAALWSDRIETSTDAENELVALRRYNKWTELAKKFKEP